MTTTATVPTGPCGAGEKRGNERGEESRADGVFAPCGAGKLQRWRRQPATGPRKGIFSAKAVGTQGKGTVLATMAVGTQGKGTVLPAGRPGCQSSSGRCRTSTQPPPPTAKQAPVTELCHSGEEEKRRRGEEEKRKVEGKEGKEGRKKKKNKTEKEKKEKERRRRRGRPPAGVRLCHPLPPPPPLPTISHQQSRTLSDKAARVCMRRHQPGRGCALPTAVWREKAVF